MRKLSIISLISESKLDGDCLVKIQSELDRLYEFERNLLENGKNDIYIKRSYTLDDVINRTDTHKCAEIHYLSVEKFESEIVKDLNCRLDTAIKRYSKLIGERKSFIESLGKKDVEIHELKEKIKLLEFSNVNLGIAYEPKKKSFFKKLFS